MDLISVARFQELLLGELDDLPGNLEGKAISDKLAYWVAKHFLGLEGANLLAKACGMQGPGEEGIDLFWVVRGDKRVVVAQAEAGRTLNLKRHMSRGIIDKLRRALSALNDADLASARERAISAIVEEYNDAIADGYSVEFWAVIGGFPNKGLERAKERFERVDLKPYPNHSFNLVDTSVLLTRYCAEIEGLPYPDITLDMPRNQRFNHGPNSILCTVTARSVARAVQDENLHIFETNARLPLLRSRINPEIAATLQSREDRTQFWNFNNGLTILCDNYRIQAPKVVLTGAQIVNGCQTAYTLSRNADKLDSVYVLCRIIRKAEPALAQRIRRATNLQNAIQDRDLRSGDIVQKTLQSGFRRRGYFYQRKRDEYDNMRHELGKHSVSAEFPKGVVDNPKLASMSLAFWHERPAEAKMKKQLLFVKDLSAPSGESPTKGFYDLVFHKGVIAEELLLPHLVAKHLSKQFGIGYSPRNAKKDLNYFVKAHGNLTLLAAVGVAIRGRYELEPPLRGRKKQVISNMIVPRFEQPRSHPEYFRPLDRAFRGLLKAVVQWIRRSTAQHRGRRDLSEVRNTFVNAKTCGQLLSNNDVKRALRTLRTSLDDFRS